MTAFATSNLPSDIDTVEKLAAWSISILAELNPTLSIVTAPGAAERVAQSAVFYFPNQTPAQERSLNVVYLPISTNWRGVGKLYKSVTPLSATAIPTAYTAA